VVTAVLGALRVLVAIGAVVVMKEKRFKEALAPAASKVRAVVVEIRGGLAAVQEIPLLVVAVVEGALRVEEMVARVELIAALTGLQEITHPYLPEVVEVGVVPCGLIIRLLAVVAVVAVEAQLEMREMRVIPVAQLPPQQLTV
jgi:hypothetical protein